MVHVLAVWCVSETMVKWGVGLYGYGSRVVVTVVSSRVVKDANGG